MNIWSDASIEAGSRLDRAYWCSELIHRHCNYSTRNLAEVQDRLRGLRDGVNLSIDRPEDFNSYREARLAVGSLLLTIGCIDSRSGYDLNFKSGEEYIVTIPLQGSGWVSTGGMYVEYSCGDIMVVAPLCRVEKHWDGPGEVLSVHIPTERFDAAMADLGCDPPLTPPILRINNHCVRSFIRVVDMLCGDLQDKIGASPFLQPQLSVQVEAVLLTLLIEGLRGEASCVQEQAPLSSALPYYVRRAERFISTNFHLAIGLDDIVRASGVSTRTLQYGFRSFLDTTPMLYLKRFRYNRARAILRSDRSGRRIADIALEIGCQNISQFSRDYHSFFGETPSKTLAAPKHLLS